VILLVHCLKENTNCLFYQVESNSSAEDFSFLKVKQCLCFADAAVDFLSLHAFLSSDNTLVSRPGSCLRNTPGVFTKLCQCSTKALCWKMSRVKTESWCCSAFIRREKGKMLLLIQQVLSISKLAMSISFVRPEKFLHTPSIAWYAYYQVFFKINEGNEIPSNSNMYPTTWGVLGFSPEIRELNWSLKQF